MRLVILLLHVAQHPHVAAQTQQASCISLNGSTTCPAFQEDSISSDLSAFPFLANVRTVQDFDTTVNDYLADGFLQSKMKEQYGCNRSTGTSFTLQDKRTRNALQIRYSKTIWCASLVQQSAQLCRGPGATAQTACAETCLAYALSIADILQSPVCGRSNLTDKNLDSLRQEYALCTTPGDAYAQQRCVDGATQDKSCGFEDNSAAYCRYCARLQRQSNGTGSSVEGCCTQANASFCAPYFTDGDSTGNISQVIVSIGLPTGVPLPTPTAVVRLEHDDRLSAGALAGIIVPSVLAVLAIILSIWLFLRRRQRFASRADRMRTLNALDSRGNESASGEKRIVIRSPTLPLPTAGSAFSAPSFGSAMSPVGPIFPPKTPSNDSEQHRLSGFYGGGFKDKAVQAEPEEELARDSSDDSLVLLDQWSGVQLKPGSLVRCLRSYEPALHDELPLRVNDLIRIEALYADRWAKGRLIRNVDDPVSEDLEKTADIAPSKVFPLVCVCAAEFDEIRDSRPSSSVSNSTRRTSLSSIDNTGFEAHPSDEALALASTVRDSVLSETVGEASSMGGSTRVPSSIGILSNSGLRRFQLRPRPSGLQQVSLPARTSSSQHGSIRTEPSSGDHSCSAESSPAISTAQQPVPTAATGPSTSERGGGSTSRFTEQLSTHSSKETKD
ncbi:hypothetical protein BCR37DRAFT_389538 [Protomyces lactucae-debilis]|uniref:SH3 domain-containing protein n=1 Tax=Protomyces lactucae-debilis TaxID=2754530 RepID=A0A1Y2EX01_PROLT|nr:uncharacterized protein BCR37DRAFT_389538 [Protomyces lactucae-debilis]ORY76090.1 hypothetical protein BCR37DRAFT_389538 [Protomyces lactucae-debilis]